MGLKTSVVTLGVLLSTVSAQAFAATFEVPRNFEIMYVDLGSPGRFGGDFKTKVDPGEHQFVVRFNQRVGGGDDAEQFQSEPYIIEMEVADQAHIVLKAPHFFRKSDAADFAENVKFTLEDKNSNVEPKYRVQMLPHQSGVQQMRNYKAEIRDFTGDNRSKLANESQSVSTASKAITEELEMLKFWYNKADTQTRKDMRIWMVDHSSEPKTTSTAFEMLTFWFNKASKEDQKTFQIWLLND